MSEGRLPIPRAISRERSPKPERRVSTSSWAAGDREPAAITAYDDLWFQGRPQLP
jgi:hypothetical protein